MMDIACAQLPPSIASFPFFRLKGVRLGAENDIPAAVDSMLSKPPTVEVLNRALAEVLTIT